MYNLKWHRSFDLCKLVDARRCTRVDALGVNASYSLIGRVDARGLNGPVVRVKYLRNYYLESLIIQHAEYFLL